MCATCGCGSETASIQVLRDEPHAHDHAHPHTHPHEHSHEHSHGGGGVVEIEARILAKNDALAAKNRGWFAGREILALNLVGAPGAGKTTLIERTIAELKSELALFVIEGDQASALDGERIRRAGAPVAQLNTGTGCHLDAGMVGHALAHLRPDPGAVVLIENVGNLVCPALFDLGEQAKIVLFSAAEGEDKPIKYPHMFRAADLVLLTKTDLLPHLDFDAGQAMENVRTVNPKAEILRVAARTGEGMEPWLAWLRQRRAVVREAVFA